MCNEEHFKSLLMTGNPRAHMWCRVCPRTSSTRSERDRHELVVHGVPGPVICSFNPLHTFMTNKEASNHEQRVHPEEFGIFPCSTCSRVFLDAEALATHALSHSTRCQYCARDCYDVNGRGQHERECTANPELVQSLARLAENAKTLELRRNEFCGSSTVAAPSWDPSVRCSVCNRPRVFSNEANYLEHRQRHLLFGRYCGSKYSDLKCRNRHEKICPRTPGK